MTSAADYHIHTCFSCDSEASPQAVCRAARDLGLREIAITDHADFTPQDVCRGYLRQAAQWQAVAHCQERFGGQLAIRAGVEIGEPHRFPTEVDELLSTQEYDVVLGALHWVGERPTFDAGYFADASLDQGIHWYLDELQLLATEGEFDVLAHLDILRRGSQRCFGLAELDWRPYESQLRAVLRTVADRRKALEVNTSFARKGMGRPGLGPDVLRWFREEGGRLLTIGSDAHRAVDVGQDFDAAVELVRAAGFEHLASYRARRATRVRLPRTR